MAISSNALVMKVTALVTILIIVQSRTASGCLNTGKCKVNSDCCSGSCSFIFGDCFPHVECTKEGHQCSSAGSALIGVCCNDLTCLDMDGSGIPKCGITFAFARI